ncbi:fumarylacetoacetate hydrolase family protein [Chitinophaga rhizosphaerae]|uniref:fumarylacetoacetate hydrolase family protein n=1 Tax=Chitinophaga rhizosphaerae TaxID=1864947 RepID=UPI000F805198|nr:fumarylacetoacetate hydrolase family protein [Chitinophaga rhizosphaerae]
MNLARIYKTSEGIIVQHNGRFYAASAGWNEFVNRKGLYATIVSELPDMGPLDPHTAEMAIATGLQAPIGTQEVWAAGVTYYRSRTARMEESENAGGATFYDKVYAAERPELFFKATPHRVSGHREVVYIRPDSKWDVPEPELTLFVSAQGTIEGYTIGNDMSSRSIEGENPLYLPQAKVYEKCAGLGPCLLVPEKPIPADTMISMSIFRDGEIQYNDSIAISQMKRGHGELVEFLFRGCAFPEGCFLMTGTCLVPDNNFTLRDNDRVEISIDHIGTLINEVQTLRRTQ